MNIPDCVSPIVGYRAWRWESSGIKSLNGRPWLPNQPFTAECRRASNGHQAPQRNCSCGIYAAKGGDALQEMAATALQAACNVISGEAYLWGNVVEHRLGWRAQFAYPKSFSIPIEIIPDQGAEEWLRTHSLLAYDADIFISNGVKRVPLWLKEAGFQTTGLDYVRNTRRTARMAGPVVFLPQTSPIEKTKWRSQDHHYEWPVNRGTGDRYSCRSHRPAANWTLTICLSTVVAGGLWGLLYAFPDPALLTFSTFVAWAVCVMSYATCAERFGKGRRSAGYCAAFVAIVSGTVGLAWAGEILTRAHP